MSTNVIPIRKIIKEDPIVENSIEKLIAVLKDIKQEDVSFVSGFISLNDDRMLTFESGAVDLALLNTMYDLLKRDVLDILDSEDV